MAIHAVEKSTVEAAIKALEVSQGRGTKYIGVFRPRIEHCSECPPEIIRRLKNLGAVVVSQPPFIYYHGERYLAQVPADIQTWLYPFKSLLDNGIVVAGSSDSPVVPPNPLVGIGAAVTRKAESGQHCDCLRNAYLYSKLWRCIQLMPPTLQGRKATRVL